MDPAGITSKQQKALQEIFKFYNKQRVLACPKKTFEAVASEMTIMSLGYFLKFLKDFEISIDQRKVKEFFAKSATGGRELSFEQFIEILERIAKEVKPDSDATEFFTSIGLDTTNSYKQKMQGFQRQAFSVREKDTQRMPQELVSSYVVKPKEVTEKIKEEIKQLRAIKKNAELEQKKRSVSNASPSEKKGKSAVQNTRKKVPKETIKRFTLLEIGKISYNDLELGKETKFDPMELLQPEDNGNSKEDPEYAEILQKFQIPKTSAAKLGSSQLKPAMQCKHRKSNPSLSSMRIHNIKKDRVGLSPKGIVERNPSSFHTISNKTMAKDRVQEIEREETLAVQKSLKHIVSIQNAKAQKGLIVAKKAKDLLKDAKFS